MFRVVINGRELSNPFVRIALLVIGSVVAAILVASAVVWVVFLLGAGLVLAAGIGVISALALAVAVPWAALRNWASRR